MLAQVIADVFKYKIASSIIILACWSDTDRVSVSRALVARGLRVALRCGSGPPRARSPSFTGVLAFPGNVSLQLNKQLHHGRSQVDEERYSQWYKWVVLGPPPRRLRYDVDMLQMQLERPPFAPAAAVTTARSILSNDASSVLLNDVYFHPRDGVAVFPWGAWSRAEGLRVTRDRERVLRRQDLKQYPLRIAAPLGYYSEATYAGTFQQYVSDLSAPERDPGIRCVYGAAALVVHALNATEVLIGTELWSTEVHNGSMLLVLARGAAELGGGALRMLPERISRLDYAVPIWPFRVGFTYVAERESSRNMFTAPFTAGVWRAVAALVAALVAAQRLVARAPLEREGAYMAVLASYLQQDASAVPSGVAGRLTFMVLSVSSMLVHAYYTSAIVSALMSAGSGGPRSLAALADSKYAIASEDYDYMRYLMFDVETNWEELEYLKRKKKTASFYQDIERGVALVREGGTAYHTEYNQLYPRMNTFSDDQLCKLQYIDTIPESMTWVTTAKRGPWVEASRAAGRRVHEAGLAARLVARLRLRAPPCRAALLAARVAAADVRPLLLLAAAGAALAAALLPAEILFARLTRKDVRVSTPLDVQSVLDFDA